jgi:peptidoglycan hydrolase CwlO-like protein
MTEAKSRRRWFQLSLRFLLVLTALVALVINGRRIFIERASSENRTSERKSLQMDIAQFERYIDECKQAIENGNGRWASVDAAEAIKSLEKKLADTKNRLNEIPK